MSRRDDRYDDQYNGYNDQYGDRNQDNYNGRFNDGYGSYSNGGYSDYGTNNDNYDNGTDNGYTDQYGNRYGGDVDQGGYSGQDGYDDGGYQGGYDDGYAGNGNTGNGSSYAGNGYADNGNGYGGNGAGGYDDGYYDQDGYDDYGTEDGQNAGGRGNRAYQGDVVDDQYGDYDDGYDDYDDDGYVDNAGRTISGSSSRHGQNGGGSSRNGRNGSARGAKAPVSTRVGGGRGGNGNGHGRKGGGKNGKRRIILLVAEIAVLLVVVLILYAVTRVTKVGKANLSEQDIQNNISDTVKTNTAMKGYRNIALFGVDSTEGQLDQKTRSDTIIIASINQDTGDVKLVSVYRDTLLNLSGGTSDNDLTNEDNYNKVNAAYAKGGPEQAINVLNTNLDMNITDFVTVGFGGLTDVVNALGGVEINVTEDEIVHLNNYQSTMAQELGMNYTEVTEPGLQTLDGLQTTAYCRIRYTRGWDYKRAARQRAVLYAIFNKAKQADPAQLTEIANNAFNEIYTSMDLSTLVADVSALANYNVAEEDSIDDMSNGFPQETARIQANLGNSLGDCVVPRTLSNNVIWLHQFLFNDSSYQPSTTVQTISDQIDTMTADAVPEEMTDADHT